MKRECNAVRRYGLVAGVVLLLGVGVGRTQTKGTNHCPMQALEDGVKMKIASIYYMTQVDGAGGNRMRMKPEAMDKFRYALVTVKVDKPAGQQLEVAAADVTLHYICEDGKTEAAPCEGMSVFNQSLAEDRPMTLPFTAGPGFTKQRTGVRASQATVVYFDAVFQGVEPNIRQAWLCVGRPSEAEPFETPGWKNENK